MSEASAFLKAILENPDDDAPRLVFADWLEEHGDGPRAEFIRAQVELAKPPAPRSRTRRRELERRVKALWKQHGKAWALQPGGGAFNDHDWERGFSAHYRAATLADFQKGIKARLKRAPIQHVHISRTRRDDVAPLVEMPVLSHFRSMELFAASSFRGEPPVMGDAEVRLLAACPFLSRLEGLDLTQHHIGHEGLRTLAHAAGLPAVRDLDMYGNPCWDDEGLRIVARSPLGARLRTLHAGGGRNWRNLTADGVRELATAPALANLRVLNLDNTQIGDEGARHLARAAHFSGLTELWLHECQIGTAGVKAIAASPHLANLEVLDLSSNWNVGNAAAVALAESPYLKRIRRLDLWRCEGINRAGEQLLRKRFRSRVNFARSY